jgi:hypothetical protein
MVNPTKGATTCEMALLSEYKNDSKALKECNKPNKGGS